MSIPATTTSTFFLFSQLPGELRNQIWRYNFPDLGVVLYSYRKGCECPQIISNFNQKDMTNLIIFLGFGHKSFRPARIEIPLFFACREAREISLAWMREKGIEVQFDKTKQSPIFVRPFDPLRDVFYIPANNFRAFCHEPQDYDLDISVDPLFFQADVKYVALIESLFRSDTFDELALRFPRLEVLFVVVDAQVEGKGDDDKSTGRWELQDRYGKALVYKPDKRKFEFEEGDSVCDEDTYERIEKASHFLTYRVLTGSSYHESISVRPVAAAKK